MEFVVVETRKGYRENDDEDEEEDEEEEDELDEGEEIGSSISKFPFSSSSSSTSKAYNDYNKRQIGDECGEVATRSYMNYKQGGQATILELIDSGGSGGGGTTGGWRERGGDREHMFDKVVTPSDVGKLNRLVIPKQHAEKYFPLHSSSSSSSSTGNNNNEKNGALLDFEDRNGKQWRFRYSYWNSSQSYVMTKGWSRFVKEKKLDAGDIVSFHRSISSSSAAAAGDGDPNVHELGGLNCKDKYRLFIDWRHRSPIQHVHHHHHVPVTVPQVVSPLIHGPWGNNNNNHHHHHHHLTQMMNYNHYPPYYFDHHHHHRHGHQRSTDHQLYSGGHYDHNIMGGTPAAGSIYYLTPSEPRLIMGNIIHDDDRTVINSVPVLHPMNPPPPPPTHSTTSSASASPKRLRLFGVNMEEHCYPIQTDNVQQPHVLPSVPYFTMPCTSTNVSHLPKAASTNVYPPPPPLYSSSSSSSSSTTTTIASPSPLPKSRNTTSLSFDLHLSDSH